MLHPPAKKVVLIGAGFSSLSAACFLQQAGFEVSVVEKHHTPGGRARQIIAEGFTFDRGPSWYWMPDIFDDFFSKFGKKTSDFYTLKRLDPSYQIFWNDGSHSNVPADYDSLRAWAEQEEHGAGAQLDAFMKDAEMKYRVAVQEGAVRMEGLRFAEVLRPSILRNVLKFDLFKSVHHLVAQRFKSPKIRQLLEFPVLFLGATAAHIPSLYTLMNYADIHLGTWYPQGGMYKVVEGMYRLAQSLGVRFFGGEEVNHMDIANHRVRAVHTANQNVFEADIVVSGADYHHTEQCLLPPNARNYAQKYWEKRHFAPSAFLFYLGLDKKVSHLVHHNLFFDADVEQFSRELYGERILSREPLFYVNIPSITDASMAPLGKESLSILIPIPPGVAGDTEEERHRQFIHALTRMEARTHQSIIPHIIYQQSFGLTDFEREYHSYKGNAYGLANTLLQTAHLKPKCRNKKIRNLFYVGQLTIPGPGVPPALLSGEIVARRIIKTFS